MPDFRGPLRVHPANPRYFTDDGQRAIYLTGSHTWAVMQDMWLAGGEPRRMDYEGFLAMMAANGHNCLRFWQWQQVQGAAWATDVTVFEPQPWERTGPAAARDGKPRFDLSRFSDAYFTRLRERVEAAGRLGIYVSVMLFEAWGIKNAKPGNDPWPYHPMHPDNNVNGVTDDPVGSNGKAWDFHSLRCPQLLAWQEVYVRRLVEALNAYDHVLYEVANEVPNTPEATAWQDHVAAFVHRVEAGLPKQHPVGITPEGGDLNDIEPLLATCADWVSPSNGRAFEYRYNPPPADGRKVSLSDTDHLWGHGAEVPWIWKSFTRGHHVLFMDPWEPIPTDLPRWVDAGGDRNTRDYPAWDAVRRNLGYTRRYAERMDLARCLPRPELCTSGFCLANEGTEYLCYLPTRGPEGLDLWAVDGALAVEWLDPATGETKAGDDLPGGRRQLVSSPFGGPGVVYLKRR